MKQNDYKIYIVNSNDADIKRFFCVLIYRKKLFCNVCVFEVQWTD